MTKTVWWSTKASGVIESAILMSALRKTCWSESNASPASSLRIACVKSRAHVEPSQDATHSIFCLQEQIKGIMSTQNSQT